MLGVVFGTVAMEVLVVRRSWLIGHGHGSVRGTGSIALLAALVLVVVWGIVGAPATSARSAGTTAATGADAKVAMIMDASSSMLQPDEGGTRLDVAKRASTELVDSLPDTARVGMIAYGTTVSDAPENHERGCEDIRTLAPVGQVDKDRLRGEIEGLEARGYTPIGNSLRAAADELDDDASERSIVLVSDGIDTCAPPPPCEVAAELADEGIGLAVHVVGFRADDATRQELECIADTTGGTYRQADDAQSLTDSMQFLTQRAIVGYETKGTDFEFADTPEDALHVGEGLYQTTVETDVGRLNDRPKQYVRVAVPEGHIARVALTPIPQIDLGAGQGGQSLDTYLSAENDSDSNCRSSTSSAHTGGGGWSAPESSVIRIGEEKATDCDDSAWAVAAQIGTSEGGRVEEVPVEMSVQFEPLAPDDESARWPAGDTGSSDDPRPVAVESPQPVAGGNSFNNAVEITEGAFSDAIVPGEFRYYRVPVEWGQRPVATIRTGPSVREELDNLHFDLYGPMRHDIAGHWVSTYEDVGELTIAADRPINFRNREANQGGTERALAGEHYLAVSMNVSGDGPSGVEQPFEFAVRMDGQPADGPDWEPVNEPGPEPSPTPPSGQESGPSGGDEPGRDGTGAGEADTGQVAMDDDDSISPTVWVLLGAGVLVLVAVVGGLWALTRGGSRR